MRTFLASSDASETAAAPDLSLICRVQTRLCAVPLAHVVETMRPLPVEPWPGAPPCVRGLAIVRGAPVPVVDVVRLLDGDAGDAHAQTERFVTVALGSRQVALAVDGVVGVRPIAAAALQELPPLLRNAAAVTAIGVLDDRLLVVLNGARLLPEVPQEPAMADEPPA